MHYESDDNIQPIFNDIRIELKRNRLNDNQYAAEYDERSDSLVPSRIARFSGKIQKNTSLIHIVFILKIIRKFGQRIQCIQVNQ